MLHLELYHKKINEDYHATFGNSADGEEETISDMKKCIALNKTFEELHPEVIKDY